MIPRERFFSAKCELFRLFLLNCDHSNKLFLLDCSQFKRNRWNISQRKSTRGIRPLNHYAAIYLCPKWANIGHFPLTWPNQSNCSMEHKTFRLGPICRKIEIKLEWGPFSLHIWETLTRSFHWYRDKNSRLTGQVIKCKVSIVSSHCTYWSSIPSLWV
jgi:hypothetical protein